MNNEVDISLTALLGFGAAGLLAIAGGAVANSFTSIKKATIEADRLKAMPDSFWEAKKAEAEASVKMHELDIAHKERMELDARERRAKELAAKREFEQSAPPEYWEAMAKKAEAEERGKTERENAKVQADAIKSAAYQLRCAVDQ